MSWAANRVLVFARGMTTATLPLNPRFSLLQKKELNVYGSRNALQKDFLALIDLVKAGKANIERVVTNEYEFADAPKAFQEFSEQAASMLKVVIHFADPE